MTAPSVSEAILDNTMVSDHTKVFLTLGIAVLIGCPSAESASVTDLLNSILETLKSIEGLMKYESSVVPQFLPKMLGDESNDSENSKAILKKLQEKYLQSAVKSDQEVVNEHNARRSFKKVNNDDDDDDKPAEPIDIQLPSRRELDAEKRKKRLKDSSEHDEDEDESDEMKNYRTHSRDDSVEEEPDVTPTARRSMQPDSSNGDDDDASEDNGAADARRSFSTPVKLDESSSELELRSNEDLS